MTSPSEYKKYLNYYWTAERIMQYHNIPQRGIISINRTQQDMDEIIPKFKSTIKSKAHWTKLFKKDENMWQYIIDVFWKGKAEPMGPCVDIDGPSISIERVIDVFRTTIPKMRKKIDANKNDFPIYNTSGIVAKIEDSTGDIAFAKNQLMDNIDNSKYKLLEQSHGYLVFQDNSGRGKIMVVFLENTKVSKEKIKPTKDEYIVPVIVPRNYNEFEKPFHLAKEKNRLYNVRKLSPLEEWLLNVCEYENLQSTLTYFNEKHITFNSLNFFQYVDPNDKYIMAFNRADDLFNISGKKTNPGKFQFQLNDGIKKWGYIILVPEKIINENIPNSKRVGQFDLFS